MKKNDLILLIVVTILTLFGLLIIYDASSYSALRDFNDQFHYIKEQTMWIILGFISLSFFSKFNYHKLYMLAIPILITSLVLLIGVFLPGVGLPPILGARRWVHIGFFVLQPAEFAKLAIAIYLAAWFSQKEKGRFLPFLFFLGLMLFLIMREPDMGTATIILAESLILYFLSGNSIKHFFYLIPIVVLGGLALIKLEPYRAARLTSFLSSGESIEHSSYHVRQILIALGSGGMFGVVIGNSLQKYAYLPDTTTDAIFAIIGEEVGYVGSIILLILFLSVILLGFSIATRAKDPFGKLLAGGIVSFLAVQMIINLGAISALFPLTGVPLPFISYGGSALVMNLSAIGILLNISRLSTNV